MNKLTNFFSNKKFLIGSEPPTQGKFEVGDLIVNTGSGVASTPMWICSKAGQPGEWSPVGVGSKYTTEKSLVVVSSAVSEVEIGIEFDDRCDTLLVFINDAYMSQDTDYLLDGNKIKVVGDEAWNENLTNDFTFEFVIFKSIADIGEGNIVISPEQIEDKSITLDKLEQSLVDALNNIEPLDLTPYQQTTSNDLITNNKTITGAINELFISANNGKELIANAIGEPLSSNDTFSAMSSDINGLLSTFKTNMMNNGVTVESGDKFKALIDKLSILADSEGEGLQMTSGILNISDVNDVKSFNYADKCVDSVGVTTSVNLRYSTIDVNELGFTPSIIITNVSLLAEYIHSAGYDQNIYYSTLYNNINSKYNTMISNTDEARTTTTASIIYTNAIKEGDLIYLPVMGDVSNLVENFNIETSDCNYIAIGVGEEDTTLRDSLASILENKGVDISEEDDMASLINKVDSMLQIIPGLEQQPDTPVIPEPEPEPEPEVPYTPVSTVINGNVSNISLMGTYYLYPSSLASLPSNTGYVYIHATQAAKSLNNHIFWNLKTQGDQYKYLMSFKLSSGGMYYEDAFALGDNIPVSHEYAAKPEVCTFYACPSWGCTTVTIEDGNLSTSSKTFTTTDGSSSTSYRTVDVLKYCGSMPEIFCMNYTASWGSGSYQSNYEVSVMYNRAISENSVVISYADQDSLSGSNDIYTIASLNEVPVLYSSNTLTSSITLYAFLPEI